MAGDEQDRAGKAPDRAAPGARRAERQTRLAEQLRVNLHRRKQQARLRRAENPEPPPEEAS